METIEKSFYFNLGVINKSNFLTNFKESSKIKVEPIFNYAPLCPYYPTNGRRID
jgi:hypothetical protein